MTSQSIHRRFTLRHLFMLMALAAMFFAGRKSHEDFPDFSALFQRKPPLAPVYVVRRDISTSESLQLTDFNLEYWPKDKVPSNAVVTLGELIGSQPKVAMYSGEPLLKNKLQRPPTATGRK